MKSKNLSAVLLIALLSFTFPVGCTHDNATEAETDNCPDDPNKTEPGLCGCGIPDIDTDGDTTLNCSDACSNDPNKAKPGFCGCGTPDTDSDSDGTPDCKDTCPLDPSKIEPGNCGCHIPDTDHNGNGVVDCLEKCPQGSLKEYYGACGCDTPDTDTDGDTTLDCNDQCAEDPAKIEPGLCGCGTPDTDTDADGTPDCIDECPEDPAKTETGICGCGTPDDNTDSDGDGTPDCVDVCPSDPDKIELGVCGCGIPDTDTDNDGTPDCIDECPDDSAKTETGICGCGTPDTDTDSDDDGTPDCIDKCPDDPQKQACPCHLSGRNAEVEIIEDGKTKLVPVCMEEGGLLQVGYMNKFQEDTVNTHEDAVNAFNSRSIEHQNIRLHYSPAGNLLSNPALEHDDTGWETENYSLWYGLSYFEDCKYQSTPCLCRAFGKYPNLIASYDWYTTFKQTIQLSNTQCKDATECSHPLTVGMFAYALDNYAYTDDSDEEFDRNDQILISFMDDTMIETVVPTETKFFTMTQTIDLSETPQNIEVTFSGDDLGGWYGNYGAALQYFGAWLGEREIRFSSDGTTWTPWQAFTPAEKGSSDAWFVEWDLGTCDAKESACTKTVYMQTHDLLTDRYYETSDSVQYIPTI